MAMRGQRERAGFRAPRRAGSLALAGVAALQGRSANLVRRFVVDANGATVVEYTLIAGLTFLAIVGGLRYYADRTEAMYQRIGTAVAGAS